MTTPDFKDELFYNALTQSIIDIIPDLQGKILNRRECVRKYIELMDA